MLARFSECPYNHLQAIPLAWFRERKRGLVLALRTNDIQSINGLLAIWANIYGEVQTERGAAERLWMYSKYNQSHIRRISLRCR